MLPKVDGLEVLRQVRAGSPVPVLMLTARTDEFDRVLGLEVGADDYLTKPFSMRELVARVRVSYAASNISSRSSRQTVNPNPRPSHTGNCTWTGTLPGCAEQSGHRPDPPRPGLTQPIKREPNPQAAIVKKIKTPPTQPPKTPASPGSTSPGCPARCA